MEAFLGVSVLIQTSTVELRQTMGIGWKMRRNPVKNDADFSPVAGIDEEREIFRRTVTGSWRELGQQLIAP